MTTSESNKNEAFSRAFLQIQTDWNIKKNTQSLVSLSALAQFRVIKIDLTDDIQNLPDLIAKAKQLATEHYEQSGGSIKFWGKIESYKLCYQTAYYEATQCIDPIWELETINQQGA